MSDLAMALVIWVPLATIIPFLLSKATGSDWRGAIVETALFATLALLLFPVTIALIARGFLDDPNLDVIFIISYVLAAVSILLFRRGNNRASQTRTR